MRHSTRDIVLREVMEVSLGSTVRVLSKGLSHYEGMEGPVIGTHPEKDGFFLVDFYNDFVYFHKSWLKVVI